MTIEPSKKLRARIFLAIFLSIMKLRILSHTILSTWFNWKLELNKSMGLLRNQIKKTWWTSLMTVMSLIMGQSFHHHHKLSPPLKLNMLSRKSTSIWVKNNSDSSYSMTKDAIKLWRLMKNYHLLKRDYSDLMMLPYPEEKSTSRR